MKAKKGLVLNTSDLNQNLLNFTQNVNLKSVQPLSVMDDLMDLYKCFAALFPSSV